MICGLIEEILNLFDIKFIRDFHIIKGPLIIDNYLTRKVIRFWMWTNQKILIIYGLKTRILGLLCLHPTPSYFVMHDDNVLLNLNLQICKQFSNYFPNFLATFSIHVILLKWFPSYCCTCMLCMSKALHLHAFAMACMHHAYLLPWFLPPLLQCTCFWFDF